MIFILITLFPTFLLNQGQTHELRVSLHIKKIIKKKKKKKQHQFKQFLLGLNLEHVSSLADLMGKLKILFKKEHVKRVSKAAMNVSSVHRTT